MSLARATDVYYRYRKRKETYLRGGINFVITVTLYRSIICQSLKSVIMMKKGINPSTRAGKRYDLFFSIRK